MGGNSITERGVCWANSINPTIDNTYSASTDKTDDFSVRITNLSLKTKYHVRAYVKTSSGDIYYGQDTQFTTTHEIFPPQVSATTVTDIKAMKAKVSASVINDGSGTIKDTGFCYSTSPNPTTSNSKKSCGGGNTSFSTTISGLIENTHYYIRAYVTNEYGTGYGEQTEFQTHQKGEDEDIDREEWPDDENWNN